MKLLTWNCRGAGSPDTLRHIVRLTRDHKPDVLFLMETRVSSIKANQIMRRTYFTHLAAVEARGFAGRLWCLWDQNSADLRIISYTSQVITLAVMKGNQVYCVISLVYASPKDDLREVFYEYVEQMAPHIAAPWLLIGDFNQVLTQEDKRGGRGVYGRMVGRMRQMIETCGLIGVEFSGPRYTWSNGQRGRCKIEQRLDQAWANRVWHLQFSSANLQHLPRTFSDHCPLLMKLECAANNVSQDYTFKFQACWMEHKLFTSFMQHAWQSYPGDLCRTISEFQLKMTKWSKEVFGSLQKRRNRCLARIAGIQKALACKPSTFLYELEKQLLEEYNDILTQEDIYWQQKSNLQWLLDGERNSRYFHICMASKRRKSQINRLKDGNGQWTDDEALIKMQVLNYYKELFTCIRSDQYIHEEPIIPTLNQADKCWLNPNYYS